MNVNEASINTLSVQTLPWSARTFVSLLSRISEGSLTLIDPQGRFMLLGRQGALPHAQLKIRDWRAASLIMRQADVGFAECVRRNWVDCPDMMSLFRLAIRNEDSVNVVRGSWWALLLRQLGHWVLRDNSRRGSRRNILAHYDLGNDFYRLWLDGSMSYSAALFEGDDQRSLPDAQAAKYDRMLDQLDIQPGQTLLEIGCGWGELAVRAARRGLKVKGVTLSDAQLAWAQERVRREGLAAQIDLSICDYRDITGQYDHIISIEMFEAVGLRHWPGYFSVIRDRLKPGGRAVIQTIDIADAHFDAYVRGTDFIQQYIFPGGMLPSPSRFESLADNAGLNVQDRFSFGIDYAKTLALWAQAFDTHQEDIQAQGFDDTFMRIWRMYLAYCEAGFREGRTDVKQWVLAKHA
ncbi:SAM-dependent methyltransferase [Orrella marina]|uniref:SAM-dependent methyltransferase n=1 Tax=Orrella marina TaxID=2163011 RepID=A0A2R4XGM4_9BURK|nr:cyclopropane-fatty-acyl-phospholipid synthase family protein [Orrella marina]AWB32869.1 SAM-dependent methyltransferase [Orrella marina]